MKNLKVITIITVFLVAMSATSLLAQKRPSERTSSAKAAYGYPTEKFKAKKKKKEKKQRKVPKRKAKTPLYRKKNPWAS